MGVHSSPQIKKICKILASISQICAHFCAEKFLPDPWICGKLPSRKKDQMFECWGRCAKILVSKFNSHVSWIISYIFSLIARKSLVNAIGGGGVQGFFGQFFSFRICDTDRSLISVSRRLWNWKSSICCRVIKRRPSQKWLFLIGQIPNVISEKSPILKITAEISIFEQKKGKKLPQNQEVKHLLPTR